MARLYKHFQVQGLGEGYVPRNITLKDNPELCTEHKEINIGDKLCLIDTNVIDIEENTHSIVPVECIYAEFDPRFPRCKWYYFRAVDSENLNTIYDNKFPMPYYRILESTSPYIIK